MFGKAALQALLPAAAEGLPSWRGYLQAGSPADCVGVNTCQQREQRFVRPEWKLAMVPRVCLLKSLGRSRQRCVTWHSLPSKV